MGHKMVQCIYHTWSHIQTQLSLYTHKPFTSPAISIYLSTTIYKENTICSISYYLKVDHPLKISQTKPTWQPTATEIKKVLFFSHQPIYTNPQFFIHITRAR